MPLRRSVSDIVCRTECVCSSVYASLVIQCSNVSCLLPKSLAHGGLVLPPPPSTQSPLVLPYLPYLLSGVFTLYFSSTKLSVLDAVGNLGRSHLQHSGLLNRLDCLAFLSFP